VLGGSWWLWGWLGSHSGYKIQADIHTEMGIKPPLHSSGITVIPIISLALMAGCVNNDPNNFSKVKQGAYSCVATNNEGEQGKANIQILISTKDKTASFVNSAEAMAAFVKPEKVTEAASAENSTVNFSNQTFAEGQEQYAGEKDAPEQARSSYALDTATGKMTRTLEYYDGMTNTPSYSTEKSFQCQAK